jgi:hypothetical protein
MSEVSDMNNESARDNFCGPGRVFSLWLIMLGPAALWLFQFQAIYTLVSWACAHGRHDVIPITSGISFLLAGVFAWLSFLNWRDSRQPAAADPAHAERRRTRFMAQMGAMMTALFALLIVAQGLAVLFFDPCQQ